MKCFNCWYDHRRQHGRIIVVSNKMAYQMFGYEVGELVGEPAYGR